MRAVRRWPWDRPKRWRPPAQGAWLSPVGACYGKQFTEAGWEAFHRTMPEALAHRSGEWLDAEMSLLTFWQPYLLRGGKQVDYNKPDAIEKLTIGEFNVAYVRVLATVLQARGEMTCVVYQADDA